MMITKSQQKIILDTVSAYSPLKVGIFGSYARGENDERSDLDILIEFDPALDLLTIIGLEQELSEKLGIKVDLITARSINPKLKSYIEKDFIQLVA